MLIHSRLTFRDSLHAFGLAVGILLTAGSAALADPSDAADRSVLAAGNRLGFSIYRKMPAGNVVVSSHSIASAMAMTLSGARGETEREMAAVLQFGVTASRIADVHRRLNEALSREATEGGALLQVSNALFLTHHGELVSPAFRQSLANDFGAELFQGADLDAVNAWVKQRTNGRIDKILTELDPNSVCVLLNAIYFKGAWEMPFDKRATGLELFHLNTERSVPVPMMRQQADFRVTRTEDYQAVRLRYMKSSLAMIVVVPNRIDGLPTVEAALDAPAASSILSRLAGGANEKLALALPLFKIELGTDLVPPLLSLGMRLPFDPQRADFSGMTGKADGDTRLHISQARHRAFIDVNEAGTEAGAATAVEISTKASPVPPTPFTVDRPFFYFIADEKTGAILFVGRVVNPLLIETRS